jgi:outer membrane protein assembly factor BamB/tRNA A-37 threonylcarbamoyl transferase component Bud32
MGAVYRARDLRFAAVEKTVAVKEMSNTAPDPRLRRIGIQNFEREANILASLSHPAIPKIFDFFSEGERSYLIMEFVQGETLEVLLETHNQPFSQEEVADWGLQICDVLAYLHSQKPPVIFRDIKPGNLMLTRDNRIVVIDFGIAKVFEHGQRGTMIGTEGYSPPEQYRGAAEPRGDLYALSATLHHLLTARNPQLEPPFTFHERPIRMFNPNISIDLEAVVMRALSYDVQERYSSATEMAQALNSAVPRRSAKAARPGTASFSPLQEIKPRWRFRCEDEVRSSPHVSNEVVYVGSYDNNLYALSAKDGSFIWKFPTQGGIASTPCDYEQIVVIGSEDNNVYAVSRQLGDQAWAFSTYGCIRSSPKVQYGHCFIGSDDGCLYALNVQTGRLVWQFQSAGPIRSTPLVVDEMVCVGSDDGYVYALDLRSGTARWKYNSNRRVTSSPTVQGDLLYVGSADGNLYAINARSGWPIWRFRTRGYVLSRPAITDDLVFVSSADGYIYAVDANSGRERWKYDTGHPIVSSPFVADDVVYVGSNSGTVHALNATRGSELWRYATGGPVPSSPTVAQGTLFVGSTDHYVYALPI